MGKKKILLINGPNLQLLGKREPEIYGSTTLADVEEKLTAMAKCENVEVECLQSNHEGDIVDKIGESFGKIDGIIINPAAYTHTSVAIRDAISAVNVPTIEVHISNIHKRESFREHSMTAAVCTGQICGLGVKGYELAMTSLLELIK